MKQAKNHLSTFAALALTVGCSGLRPPPAPDFAPPPPASWEVSEQLVSKTPLESNWWSSFADPQLERLIQIALESNHDLAAAAARLDAALAQARIAGAALSPQVAASADAARRKQNFIGLPIPGAEGQVLSNTSTSLGVSFNVSWEADLWGRLRNTRSGSQSLAEASLADLEAARLSLAGQTAKTWFALLEAKGQLGLARETLVSRELTAKQIRRRYERGLRTALDLRLALTNEANAESTLRLRERQFDTIQRQLQVLLGRYPTLPTDLTLGAGLPEIPSPAAAGVPAGLVAQRPDLRASERRLAAAGFDIASARASLYPQLRLTGSAGRSTTEPADLLDNDFSVWSLAEGLLQPLFQGGRLRAGVDLAEARQREVAHGHAQRILLAFNEVETSLATEASLAESYEAVARAVEQSTAAEKLAQDRYLRGLNDYLTVLETQRQATIARSLLIDVHRQQLAARVDLHLALGGDLEAKESLREEDPSRTSEQAAKTTEEPSE